jgi:hypothetical protein
MHTVGLVVYPHFQSLALAVASVFEYANLLRGEATYEFSILSEHGGPIASSQGFSVHSEPLLKKATTRSSWAATDRKSHSGSQAEQSMLCFFVCLGVIPSRRACNAEQASHLQIWASSRAGRLPSVPSHLRPARWGSSSVDLGQDLQAPHRQGLRLPRTPFGARSRCSAWPKLNTYDFEARYTPLSSSTAMPTTDAI